MNAYLLAALVAGSPSFQSQNAARAFDWEPMPIAKIGVKLAGVLGEPVQVAKSLWPTTLMVTSPSATVSEVQTQIAKATNATWSKRGGVWYLEQTPEQIKADERIYRLERLQSIQRLIDHNRKQMQALKPFTAEHARNLYEEMRDFSKVYGASDNERASKRINELEQESPPSRLNRRVLLALDAETLASVKPRERKVFSTNPTPMQSPMPGEVSKVIAQYVDEQNLWASVTGEQPVVNVNGEGLGIEFGANVEPITQPVGTVLLTVDGDQDDTFLFRLSVFDKTGKFMLETESSSWDLLMEEDFIPVTGEEEKVSASVPLPPESRALVTILPGLKSAAQAWSKVTEPMLALWRKPVTRDPLSYYVGGFLAAEAKTRRKSLVAVVPDTYMEQFNYGYIATIETYQRRNPSLNWLVDAEVKEDGTWIQFRPSNPLRIRKAYQDRAVLQEELAMGARLDPPTLEEEAELALKKGLNGELSGFQSLAYALRANPLQSGNMLNHLRVYAAMTQPGRTAAYQKGGVPLSRLPKAVQDEIHRLVYNGDPYSISIDDPTAGDSDEENAEPNPKLELFWNGIFREPTVSMPRGIPLNTTIAFEVETSYLIQTAPNPIGRRQGELVGATDLAERTYMAAHPKMFPWMKDTAMVLNTSKMRLILSRLIKITYNFQNGFRTIGTLQELRPMANKTFTLENLPPEIKEEFVKAQNELEFRMKNRNPEH